MKLDCGGIRFKEDGKLESLIIVGICPKIIRLAVLINNCRLFFDAILTHTGRNYEYNFNSVSFKDLTTINLGDYMDVVGNDLSTTVGNIINCSYKLMN